MRKPLGREGSVTSRAATFDHIVIGAGSAGCVVAARLSEDPNREVLVLEAGGSNRRLEVMAPAAFGKQFHSKRDRGYLGEPEPTLAGRRMFEPRGRMLGGTSSMNCMVYIRGNRFGYDSWANQGVKGWSYDEVLPYFKRSENNLDIRDEYHGVDGELTVTSIPAPDLLTSQAIDAFREVGCEHNPDFNGARQDGAGQFQVTQRSGTRLDTATAFLRPVRRRTNLTVRKHALVHRILVEHGRAVGVELSRDGRLERAYSRQEVVLSAGTFGSPEILQRSGIGPADHLRSVGIEPVVDLPAVGPI